MIEKRELLAKARARRLPLAMVEKDYVLGWALFGLSQLRELVFKGGTALTKVYFPETWRLSEDLDFVSAPRQWDDLPGRIPDALTAAAERSGIDLQIRSRHANPAYLKVKIQYSGPLGKNWLKIDVTPEPPIDRARLLPLSRSYSDYPAFKVRVESLEEIMAQKLRALVERKKVRDYYDVWRMCQLEFDRERVAGLFERKLSVKGTAWRGLADVFPSDVADVLGGYWSKELGRLVDPVPEMSVVLEELQGDLSFLRTPELR